MKNLTYDIFFDDDTNSNNMGFKESLQYCMNYIKTWNGSKHSYFEDYKGGIVRIICHETEEAVFTETVN